MLSIFNDFFNEATLRDRWDAPHYFRQDGRPKRAHEIEREMAEAKRRQMRNAGLW